MISDGITAIGNSVFERCSNMETVSFPSTLTAIGERAFFMYSQGGIKELNLPASVTTIGEKAFTHYNGSTLTLPATLNTLGTYLFMDSETLTNARVECAEIPGFCFVMCTRLQSLTLSHNVKKIGSCALNYTPIRTLDYEGSLEDWAAITKLNGWDGNSGDLHGLTKVQCLDGYMEYDRENREWKVGE